MRRSSSQSPAAIENADLVCPMTTDKIIPPFQNRRRSTAINYIPPFQSDEDPSCRTENEKFSPIAATPYVKSSATTNNVDLVCPMTTDEIIPPSQSVQKSTTINSIPPFHIDEDPTSDAENNSLPSAVAPPLPDRRQNWILWPGEPILSVQ